MDGEPRKRYIDLERLYKERDEVEKKIIEQEMVMQGDGIWCKKCGNFIPIYKGNFAYTPDHIKDGFCYMCAREHELCNNRDRLMQLMEGGKLMDLKPNNRDGDSIEWLVIQARDGSMRRLTTRSGELINLRHEIRKVRK
jgi:hypothetical protein